MCLDKKDELFATANKLFLSGKFIFKKCFFCVIQTSTVTNKTALPYTDVGEPSEHHVNCEKRLSTLLQWASGSGLGILTIFKMFLFYSQ